MHGKSECDFCGQPISEKEFQKGYAVIILKKAYCRKCAKDTAYRTKSSAARNASSITDQKSQSPGSDSEAHYSLKQGDHACSYFSNPAERHLQLIQFVQDGIRNREKVLIIADADAVDHPPGTFEKGGLSIVPFLRSGQLEIHPASHVYAPGGVFDPVQMMARIQLLLEQCTKEGYVGLRGMGEMSWALRGWPGSDRLGEYEATLDALGNSKLTALCQYDVSRFSAPILEMVRKTHRRVFAGTPN